MNMTCANNITLCDVTVPNQEVFFFGIFMNLLSLVQKFILIYLIVNLKTVSRICKYIWVNDLIANIGINVTLAISDILKMFFQLVLTFSESVVITIAVRSFIMMSMTMFGANMYHIYLAFRSGFEKVNYTSLQIYVTIGVLWLWNIAVSCTVLLDMDMLLPDPNYLVEYKLTEYGIWIIVFQLLNTFMIPQSVFFYSAWRIYQYNKQRKTSTTRQQFDRGVRLAILIFKLNIIQMVLVTPIIIVSFFSYTFKQAGIYHPTAGSVFFTATFACDFLKLPIFLLRNTELRSSFTKLKKKFCCAKVNPNVSSYNTKKTTTQSNAK